MGALGDDLAPVEHALIAAFLLGVLGGQNAGQQVQGLDVAVLIPAVLHAGQLHGLGEVPEGLGGHGDPQIGGHALGEGMVPGRGAAGDLEVDEAVLIVHAGDHIVQDGLQLGLGVGNLDTDQTGGIEQTVHMLIQQEDVAVGSGGGVIHAVAEVADAVVHGDHNALGGTDGSVIVCNAFHVCCSLLFRFKLLNV